MPVASDYKLFEYAIYWVPTDKDYNDDGLRPTILVQPHVVVARTQDHAKTLASREIPEEYVEDLEQIVVAVRPF